MTEPQTSIPTSISGTGFLGRLGVDRLPLLGWAGVAAALLAEALAVSFRFDALRAEPVAGLGWVMAHLSAVFRGVVFAGIATLLFGGRRLLDRYAAADLRQGEWWISWPYLVGQGAAFVVFFRLSAPVLEGGLGGLAHPGFWVALWAASGVATLVVGLAAAVPPALWGPLLKSIPGPAAVGAAVGIAATFVGSASQALWEPLSTQTLRLVTSFLGLIHPVVINIPEQKIVGTPSFHVQIAPVCSGFEGIGLMLVLLGGYLAFQHRRLRLVRALPLVPLGVLIVWLCNALRITALVTIGAWGRPDIALSGFHSQAGWLAFNAVALGIIALAQNRVFWRDGEARSAASRQPNAAAPYLAPLLCIVAATMIGAAVSAGSGLDRAYPLRVLAAGAAFWLYRHKAQGVRASWSWEAVGIGALVFLIWMALEPTSTPGSSLGDDLAHLPSGWAAAWVVVRVLGAVVTVPLAEELAFRGFLIRRLIAADFEKVPAGRFTWISLLGSSVLFGVLHGRWLAGTLAGLFYALALYRRGRLSDAIVAHATTNALIAACVLGAGMWSLWQ